MPKDKKIIVSDFVSMIRAVGGDITDWYVGVTDDVDVQLFEKHLVDVKGINWTFAFAQSPQEARSIEEWFVKTMGTDGGVAADQGAVVYAYRKIAGTSP